MLSSASVIVLSVLADFVNRTLDPRVRVAAT